MGRIFVAIIALLLSDVAVLADGYSEVSIGIVAYDQDDWAAAISYMTMALARPDLPATYKPVAYFVRADALAEKGNLEKAIDDYSACLSADPNYLEALLHRAGVYATMGRSDLAVADYSALVAKRPASVQSYWARGDYYNKLEKYDLAIADFGQIIKYEPNSGLGYGLRGGAYFLAREYDEALKDLNKSIDTDNAQLGAHTDRAALYREEGKYGDALEDYEEVLKQRPEDPTSYLWVGQEQWVLGHYADAVATLTQGITAHPSYTHLLVWQFIAMASNGARNDDLFRREVSAVGLTDWPGPVVNVFLGRLSPEEAVIAAETSTSNKVGDTCEADFYIGEWYAISGKKTAALPLLQATRTDCTRDMLARDGAIAALKRL